MSLWGVYLSHVHVQEQIKVTEQDEAKLNLDPVIVGPWMDLWDIDDHVDGKPNRHLDAYLATPLEARDVESYISAENW